MERGDEARASKLALNQSTFRNANERIERAAESHHFDAGQGVPFLCECADPGCYETVMLSLDAYEEVRSYPRRFFLVAGHEDGENTHERILEAEHGYAIVEKIGDAGKEAARLSPREDTASAGLD